MKPSSIKEIVIKFHKIIPFGNYFAMMWCGFVYIREKNRTRYNKIKDTYLMRISNNHEMIHIKQALKSDDSWVKYYFNYCIQYIKNAPLIFGFNFAYYMNPYELEAYMHELYYDYPNTNMVGETGLDKFKKLNIKEKRKIYKGYKEMYKLKGISFGTYIRQNFYI